MLTFFSGLGDAAAAAGGVLVTTALFDTMTGALFVLLVTGQILAGLAINQFGLLGVPAQPMTLSIAVGALLVIAGAALVTFGAAT